MKVISDPKLSRLPHIHLFSTEATFKSIIYLTRRNLLFTFIQVVNTNYFKSALSRQFPNSMKRQQKMPQVLFIQLSLVMLSQ